jgi:hypothetical protein
MLERWQVYYVFCQQAKPNPKHKFVVVAHVNKTWCYAFFINSVINPFIANNPKLMPCEVALAASSHTFLQHDSFIDCRDVYTFPLTNMTDFRGQLDVSIIPNVLTAVSACPVLKRGQKKVILGS